MRLPQREQPQTVVEVAVGEEDALDRRVARRRGWIGGKLSIWARISGEALMRNQSSPSALTATDSWVRGVARIAPVRTPRQLGQPQFHWGSRPRPPSRAPGPASVP